MHSQGEDWRDTTWQKSYWDYARDTNGNIIADVNGFGQ